MANWLNLLCAVAVLAATGPASAAVPAPRLAIADLKHLPTPLPFPYDEKASPVEVGAQIDAAFARARATGKRVIIDFGGNWCSWCRLLAATMDLPEARPFIAAHFEVVEVDASLKGKTDHNQRIVHRFGLTQIARYPWLIVAEPDGKVLASSYAVTDEFHHTPQSMIDWIAQWAKPTSTRRP
ncbi:MAG TPA: thioredoxin family protein [Caulobacteraceae bacterium]